MNTASLICTQGLTKIFQMGRQQVRALDGLDLEIPANSFTTIMGPSGSGKSTLLYILGGLDRPTGGSVKVDGVGLEKMDENDLAIYRRNKVGFVFQSFNLVTSMTALENVAFPMRFMGTPGRKRHDLAQKLLAQVGLEKRAHHRPTELSGGQQQRVAIARALVNNPPLILADEPTGNLDTSSGMSIMQLLSELHNAGRTVVVVTHDPRMLRFATHVVYLLDGKSVSEAEYRAASEMQTFESHEEISA
ncbi:ABC transporter ATP-binding protein [Levilinea saccharolytica]|uniref:ABC-type antimicrobial peptide transport system, ATPase component n=1 Tax=Levilinea saccharolytica TaxID=229921 RepID=A0A0M8JQQ8_9CHLR|nr:ABC transporter ATP-binding protein [Levilinea saccharolytica]KPL82226.1 macrolide ABC transporter ATP-binding protein [Levilinea saccharolytica]GAP19458.1 ABC-type antimicrobial peptide transport system, ATPase component [Levilinea saccharolytica]